MADIETWKIIEGFENYMVSTFGNVKNITTNRTLKPNINCHGYYYVSLWKNNKGKTQKNHKLVADAFLENPDNKKCVDHINRDRLNNNVSNLRWATKSENGMNKQIQRNNTSGVTGVNWDKQSQKWSAYIKKDGKKKHLGYYDDIQDAKEAREKAEKELFKEFRPNITYNINNSTNITINNNS